jgi:hypothetical protein
MLLRDTWNYKLRHFKMHLEIQQVGTAFESKAKTKRRSNAHRRHTQILVIFTAVATTIIRSVSFIEPVADIRESRTPMVVSQCDNNVYTVW